MKLVRIIPQIGRVGHIAAGLLIGVLALTACSLPQFGESQEGPSEFEATPYVAGESVQTALEGDAAIPEQGDASGVAAGAGTPSVQTTQQVDAQSDEASSTSTARAAASASSVSGSTASGTESTVASTAEQPANRVGAGPVSYTAEVVPKNRLDVVAEVSGMVLNVQPEIGDVVSAGALLVEIDSATLEAQRAQALAALQAAQAQLDLVLEQIEPEEADLEAAQAAVNAAAAAYNRALEGATEEDRRAALAQLKQAEAAVTVAQAAYNRVKGNPMIGALPESLQLQQATLAVEAAQAQYDKVLRGSTADVTSGAYAQLANARAQLDRLERGPESAQIRALEAQVQQAETALYLSQLQLEKTVINAPIDGIVAELNVAEGAMVAPGAPVLSLLSPENEVTVAVEESRLNEIELGRPVVIRVDAYPDRSFAGEIVRIAPELDPATRTIDVVIRPIDEERQLAPGMFATVEIEE